MPPKKRWRLFRLFFTFSLLASNKQLFFGFLLDFSHSALCALVCMVKHFCTLSPGTRGSEFIRHDSSQADPVSSFFPKYAVSVLKFFVIFRSSSMRGVLPSTNTVGDDEKSLILLLLLLAKGQQHRTQTHFHLCLMHQAACARLQALEIKKVCGQLLWTPNSSYRVRHQQPSPRSYEYGIDSLK